MPPPIQHPGRATTRRAFHAHAVKTSVLVFLGLFASALEGQAGAKIRDSAGIRIIENTGPAWGLAEAWTIDSVPITTVGENDDPHALFRAVLWAALLNDSIIALSDYQSFAIAVFDAAGRHLATFGRKGDGPGEFTEDPRFCSCRGDTVVVWDPNHRRVTWFSFAGRLLRDETVPKGQAVHSLRTDGRLFIVRELPPPPKDGFYVRRVAMSTLTPAGRTVDFGTTNFRQESIRYPKLSRGARRAAVVEGPRGSGFFERMFLFGDGEFPVTAADWQGWELQQYDDFGRIRRIIRRPLTRRHPIPKDYQDNLATQMPRASIPDSFSLIQTLGDKAVALLRDDAGNLWVGRQRPLVLGRYTPWAKEYDVVDRSGRWLGVVEIPEGRVMSIGKRYILIGVSDDDGTIVAVRKYRINKPKD